MAHSISSKPPWSDEVIDHFTIQGLDLVSLVEYHGEDLHADIQLRMVAAKKVEMQNHIDRLAAFPFAELDDNEFHRVNQQSSSNEVSENPEEKNAFNLFDSNDFWGIETNDNSGGWGTDAWATDGDTSSCSDDCNSIVDEDISFFESHIDMPDDAGMFEPSSCFGEGECPGGFASIAVEWGDGEYGTNVTSLEKRLKWKFPSAFEMNEKTVAHTEDDMGHYLEAADFLIRQAKRLCDQRLERQKRAFRRMTRLPYTREDLCKSTSVVDWDLVTRNLNTRMAERKTFKRSKLSFEIC
ncbi:hypothetical protein PFICI_09550 [Pestalotiopsis fici W106-1]|uniref:Uncharacterized protein n=1 Tax=Pestalotiopsis fici (strain W106-1 / CGMCC3.15140) TaxID=1229662 RepID=W3X2S3_PESFW|nr:uncharacterized protein PFICI_09550 [Pestalotiopsis fici W106-1]ETS79697.1 hypothetical protein PFICI_09550 [Pestalotiopsis fici W106-1]